MKNKFINSCLEIIKFTLFSFIILQVLEFYIPMNVYNTIHIFVVNNLMMFILIILLTILLLYKYIFFTIKKIIHIHNFTYDITNIFLFVFIYSLLFCLILYKVENAILQIYIMNIIVLLFIIYFAVMQFFHSLIFISKKNDNPLKIDDDPINNKLSEDKLGYDLFILKLVEIIHDIQASKNMVISINSGWGTGKTSIFRLLQKQLNKEKKYILCDFNPWHYQNISNIDSAFCNEIISVIEKEYSFLNITSIFKRYFDQLSLKISPFSCSLKFKDMTLNNLKNKIENILLRNNKQIIVFVDDIDRLQKNEILEIFKLVKLNANLKNFIFILAFDEQYLIELFSADSGHLDILRYIDKIIQYKLEVPKFNFTYLIHSCLKQMPKSNNISLTDCKRIIKFVNKNNNFFTARKIKKIFILMHTCLKSIEEPINYADLFFLNIIYLFFHDVYLDICKDINVYFNGAKYSYFIGYEGRWCAIENNEVLWHIFENILPKDSMEANLNSNKNRIYSNNNFRKYKDSYQCCNDELYKLNSSLQGF